MGCRKPSVEFPDLVLSKIFGYLSVKDLLTVQCVSDNWLSAAGDPEIWKHVKLKIDNEESVESVLSKLQHLPLLKHIESESWHCNDSKAFIQGLVKYVKNLKILDIVFYPYLAAEPVKWIVKNLPTLELINLNYNAPDIEESLKALKGCKHLKYVHFNFNEIPFDMDSDNTYAAFILRVQVSPHLSQLSIDKLDIVFWQNHAIGDSDLLLLLKHKADRLRSLNAVCDSQKIFNAILGCAKLQELTLIVKFLPALLSFTPLRDLKFLNIYEESPGEKIPSVEFPESLEKLVWNCLHSGGKQSVIFTDDIMSGLQNLRHLQVSVCFDSDIDDSLNTIANLPELHTLVLRDVEHLTDKGIEHIAKCQQLRHLVIENIPVTNESLNHISKCSNLQSLGLNKCECDADNLYKMLTKLKHLREVKLADESVVHMTLKRLEKEDVYINIKVQKTENILNEK